jgi:hypothetical protein
LVEIHVLSVTDFEEVYDHNSTPDSDMIAAMSIDQIISALTEQRDRLNRAIQALGGPIGHDGPFPMRPKRGWTAAQKKAQAAAMKAFWAKRKRAKR